MPSELAESLRQAQTERRTADYIEAVKAAVASELQRIDPSAHIRKTDYFNHSAIPDFVMRWSKSNERLVYLRSSYSAVWASRDAEFLNENSPVIVTVGSDQDRGLDRDQENTLAAGRLSESLDGSWLLLTEPDALDAMASVSADQASPSAGLVKEYFLKDARGLVDGNLASSVLASASDGVNEIGSDELVERLFPEGIAERIAEARDLMRIALSSTEQREGLTWPSLNRDQARQVLPWLLNTQEVRQDAAFWQHIGSNLDLAFILAEMSSVLEGTELMPLIRANADQWTAVRGYLGAQSIDPDTASLRWTVLANRLVGRLDDSNVVRLAANRHLKGNETGVSSAQWSDLRPRLSEFPLRRITLRGVQRQIRLDAETSHDITADVDRVTETLEDTYYVDTLTLQLGSEEERIVTADLGSSLASSESGATIDDLVRVLGRAVKYKEPASEAVLSSLLLAPAQQVLEQSLEL